MSTPDEAFAAGLFEGEGTVYADAKGYPHARICMTDREPLERMLAICGGRIYGPYPTKRDDWKPIYRWDIWGWDAVEGFYAIVREWLCPRRLEQFRRTLAQAPPLDQRAQGWHKRAMTHCKRGHPFDDKNTAYQMGRCGRQRLCRACPSEKERARAAR